MRHPSHSIAKARVFPTFRASLLLSFSLALMITAAPGAQAQSADNTITVIRGTADNRQPMSATKPQVQPQAETSSLPPVSMARGAPAYPDINSETGEQMPRGWGESPREAMPSGWGESHAREMPKGWGETSAPQMPEGWGEVEKMEQTPDGLLRNKRPNAVAWQQRLPDPRGRPIRTPGSTYSGNNYTERYPNMAMGTAATGAVQPQTDAAATADDWVVMDKSGAIKPAVVAPAPAIVAAPAVAETTVVSETTAPSEITSRFNALVGAAPASTTTSTTTLPALAVTEEVGTPASVATSTATLPAVAVTDEVGTPAVIEPTGIVPTATLSPESKEILSLAPSGIDSRKHFKTPDPIIIRRTDAAAGNIPTVDYRAHEEMGLKIEVRKPPVNVEEYLEQAYDNLMKGNKEVAIGFYNEVLRIEPKNEMALFGLATTYHKDGRVAEARELYGRLLAANPSHREGLNNFLALVSEESPQDAVGQLLELEASNPDFSPIPAQLGILYNKIGEPQRAAEKLARALSLSPDNIPYKYNLAITMDKLGQYKQATDLYFELVDAYNRGETVPGDIEGLRNRAIFLSNKGSM